MKERIKASDFLGGKCKAGRIENLVEAFDVSTPIGPGAIGGVRRIRREDALRSDPPAPGGRRAEQVTSVMDRLPQGVRPQRAWQDAGLPDNGDRFEGRSRHASSGLRA